MLNETKHLNETLQQKILKEISYSVKNEVMHYIYFNTKTVNILVMNRKHAKINLSHELKL